jgi:hypothetical protein
MLCGAGCRPGDPGAYWPVVDVGVAVVDVDVEVAFGPFLQSGTL